ncbi:MAG TPA: TIGR02757 family protein [Balneolales bacterium]|nr:TIGR02757 family protein [Balneolales bacterium]
MAVRKPFKTISDKKLIELKPYLDELVWNVEQPEYIEHDPVSFMHAFNNKKDQELAGFFAAIMAWGRRDIVLAKVEDLLQRMNNKPGEFIGNFSESDFTYIKGFKHRTFKDSDIYWIIRILSAIIQENGSFENFWESCYQLANNEHRELMGVFHEKFFSFYPETPHRVRKHIATTDKNSSCKRLYLYLRWSLRKNSIVDPGIMDFMPVSELKIPLDVHVARYARKLGLLSRRQNNWKAVLELTRRLQQLDPDDPAKYDYALFGLGILDFTIPTQFIINPKID